MRQDKKNQFPMVRCINRVIFLNEKTEIEMAKELHVSFRNTINYELMRELNDDQLEWLCVKVSKLKIKYFIKINI